MNNFPPKDPIQNPGSSAINRLPPLGVVVGGSLSDGLEIKLNPSIAIETIQLGSYVTIQGIDHRFFGTVTDISLGVTDPRMRTLIPNETNPFVTQILSSTNAFGTLQVRPQLLLPLVAGIEVNHSPARTIPAHFAEVSKATEGDIGQVFGHEDSKHFWVGNPLDMESKVCIDMEVFVQRSNGIFGKSGTGKSFLTRLLLAGIIQKTTAVSLVFDMANEHGWMGRDPERRREVKGLKQLFGSRVAIYSLDPESSLSRGVQTEREIRFSYDDIEAEDIELLASTLKITPLGVQATHEIAQQLGREWLRKFLEMDIDQENDIAETTHSAPSTLRALKRGLQELIRPSFLTPSLSIDILDEILETLDRGTHVILEFGSHGRSLSSYMLVANLLTRRIHRRYIRRVEQAMGRREHEPRPLVICIEEAHRFLDPSIASQTVFGTIAREMRKYNVSLLVVDQRPSAIDPEVLSQLGTRVAYPLADDHDISSILSGTSGSSELRGILARLENRQQAMIFGAAVPIPVVVQVRDYGTGRSYDELTRSHIVTRMSSDSANEGDKDDLFD